MQESLYAQRILERRLTPLLHATALPALVQRDPV